MRLLVPVAWLVPPKCDGVLEWLDTVAYREVPRCRLAPSIRLITGVLFVVTAEATGVFGVKSSTDDCVAAAIAA